MIYAGSRLCLAALSLPHELIIQCVFAVPHAPPPPTPFFDSPLMFRLETKLVVFGGINLEGFLPPSVNIYELGKEDYMQGGRPDRMVNVRFVVPLPQITR